MSLIELLVAIAITAVLVGLLLVAVQQVRGAASKAACVNNVRQVGLALHQYHDTEGRFPAAVRTRRVGGKEPYLSWRARLLPFIEQQALWDQTLAAYRTQPDPFADPIHVGRETALQVFACPADGRLSTAWEVTTRPGHTVRTAFTSYLGVSGTESRRKDGIIYPNSAVRLADISDGSSATLLIGERPPSKDLIYGWWYAGSGQGGGFLDAHLGTADRNRSGPGYHGCPTGPYRFRPFDVTDDCSAFGFWSLHPGGSHFAFADGSTRFVSYAAADVLSALATRAGNEVVTTPW